jgi:4'-phosphopantetheinyl transferase EntD
VPRAGSTGLAGLFADSRVQVEESDLLGDAEILYPEEAALVSTAVPSRQREFAIGRSCARRALARLGVAAGPLLAGPDRAPRWPAGVVGSITHTNAGGTGFCAAAVAESRHVRSLGVDAESSDPLPRSLWGIVLGSEEAAAIEALPEAGRLAKVVFAAKEATYKAISAFVGKVLEFGDVSVRLSPRTGTFTARLRVPREAESAPPGIFQGRFAIENALVFTAVAISAVTGAGGCPVLAAPRNV